MDTENDPARIRLSPDRLADCDVLVSACSSLMNQLHGKPIPADARHLNDAQTLAKKVVMHIESGVYLARGSAGRDHLSIAVLIRAAYESLLVFNYIFVDPGAAGELRYERWKLCGLRERTAIKGFDDPRSQEEIAASANLLSALEDRVRSIVTSDGKIMRNGEAIKFKPFKYRDWKPGWGVLAAIAGFEQEKADCIYAYLSGYAHGDSVAALQIDQAARESCEPALSNTMIMYGCIVLAYLIDLYPLGMKISRRELPKEVQQVVDQYRSALRPC